MIDSCAKNIMNCSSYESITNTLDMFGNMLILCADGETVVNGEPRTNNSFEGTNTISNHFEPSKHN